MRYLSAILIQTALSINQFGAETKLCKHEWMFKAKCCCSSSHEQCLTTTCKHVLDELTDVYVFLSPRISLTINSQPLLCISLLALLLLPLSLSCYSKRPHQEVRDDYRVIVQIDISNAVRNQFFLFDICILRCCTQGQYRCTVLQKKHYRHEMTS